MTICWPLGLHTGTSSSHMKGKKEGLHQSTHTHAGKKSYIAPKTEAGSSHFAAAATLTYSIEYIYSGLTNRRWAGYIAANLAVVSTADRQARPIDCWSCIIIATWSSSMLNYGKYWANCSRCVCSLQPVSGWLADWQAGWQTGCVSAYHGRGRRGRAHYIAAPCKTAFNRWVGRLPMKRIETEITTDRHHLIHNDML